LSYFAAHPKKYKQNFFLFLKDVASRQSRNFYICSSVHRNFRLKKSNKMQQYANIYLLLNYSTCFGRPSHPSSGVHKTVVAASGTDHTLWGASFLKRDQIRTGVVRILTTLAEANRTKTTNTHCVCTVLRYSWWWTVDLSETCRVLYQINLRNSASHWL
jgi:hypothetical protein